MNKQKNNSIWLETFPNKYKDSIYYNEYMNIPKVDKKDELGYIIALESYILREEYDRSVCIYRNKYEAIPTTWQEYNLCYKYSKYVDKLIEKSMLKYKLTYKNIEYGERHLKHMSFEKVKLELSTYNKKVLLNEK